MIAIGTLRPGISPQAAQHIMPAELLAEWKLQKQDVIRQTHSRTDATGTMFMMEVTDLNAAKVHLGNLPLVKQGLMDFELIPYAHYTGYGLIFEGL